jgi:hypothetical protein
MADFAPEMSVIDTSDAEDMAISARALIHRARDVLIALECNKRDEASTRSAIIGLDVAVGLVDEILTHCDFSHRSDASEVSHG